MNLEMDLYQSLETKAREAFQKYLTKLATGKSVLDEWCEFEESVRALRIYACSVGREDWTKKVKLGT